MLGACTEEPQPTAKKEVKPVEPVTAVSAAYKVYREARGWAPDIMLLRVSSVAVKDMKGQEGGKAGAWEVEFVSPKLRQSRHYVYSAVDGVSGDPAASWSKVGQTQIFQLQDLKTDSPAAFTTAMTKAQDYAAKHPELPVKFLCEWQKRHLNPTWRVYWGESVATSGYSVYVDAVYDKFLSIAH
jgi:hypothetical protein